MKRYPLHIYVISVVFTLLLANFVAWFVGDEGNLKTLEIFSSAFLLGMLAMYIAVHIYKYK